MKNNFDVITHSFDEEITIVPLSDLHIGASNCMVNEIKKIIKEIAETPNCYCTLGGDIVDNAVIVGKNLGLFDSKSPLESIEEAVEILKPIKDKILGVVSGNHEDRSEKVCDINPLYLICSELGIQDVYRPSMAIIKINLGSRKNNTGVGRRQCYTILLHHGKGSSESALKKDKEFVNNFQGVDVICTGHTHNGRVARHKNYVVNKFNNVVSEVLVTCIVSNSFLKDAEYGIKNMLVGADNTVITYDLKLGSKKVIVHY